MVSAEKPDPPAAPFLAALVTLGLITFATLGWIIGYRESHLLPVSAMPVADAASDSGVGGVGAMHSEPLAVLRAGVRRSVRIGAQSLRAGNVREAAEAIEAGRIAAEVGRYAADASQRHAFEEAFQEISSARHAVQNGHRAFAAGALDAAFVGLGVQAGLGTNVRISGDSIAARAGAVNWAHYAGAQLVNAEGRVIGVVVRIQPRSAGGSQANLTLGGYHHVLGAFDFGGRPAQVSTKRLIFGEPRTVGPVMVVLATLASSVDAVRREVSSPALVAQ